MDDNLTALNSFWRMGLRAVTGHYDWERRKNIVLLEQLYNQKNVGAV